MIKRNSLSVFVSFVIAVASGFHATAQNADIRVTIDELNEVLAKVDGKPIRKSDVYPKPIPLQMSLEQTVKPTVTGYIDRLLVAQAAAAEGLDETPAFRDGMAMVEQKAALAEVDILGRFYQSRLPAIIAAGDRSTITDAEASAYVKRNPDHFRGKSRKEAIAAARPFVARDRYIGAQIDWMTENLKQPVTINGDAIPEATISEAIDAADARYWAPTSVLIDAVIKIVIAQEAGSSGDNRKEIRADAERVRKLIAVAELGVGDKTVVLGHSRDVNGVLSLINPADMPKIHSVILELTKNIVMADMARAEGLDKDGECAAKLKWLPLMTDRGRNEQLVQLYRDANPDTTIEALTADLRSGVQIEYTLIDTVP